MRKFQKIFDAGIEAGLRKAEEEREARRWNTIARYCQQNPSSGSYTSASLLKGMVELTADGDVPFEAQQVWLLKIYRRLGEESYE